MATLRPRWAERIAAAIAKTSPADAPAMADVALDLDELHRLLFRAAAVAEQRERAGRAAGLARRLARERHELDEAVGELAGVLGGPPPPLAGDGELMGALAVLGRELGVTFRPPAQSEEPADRRSRLDAIAEASRLRLRPVRLDGDWWHADCGPLLAYLDDEHPVALVRRGGGYALFDPRNGSTRPLSAGLRDRLAPLAVTFYRPFPDGPVSLWQLPAYAVRPYRRAAVAVVLLSLAATLLGMLVPLATRWIVDLAIPDADRRVLLEVALMLAAVSLGRAAFQWSLATATLRLTAGGTAAAQAATWDRLLRLPVGFFRRFASGDLLNRALMVSQVSQDLGATALRSFLTGVLSLLNLGLLFWYSPPLAWLAVLFALASAAATAGVATAVRRRARLLELLRGRLYGFVVQVVEGVGKLRAAGAERRAFARWARRYAEQLRLTASEQRWQDAEKLLSTALGALAVILLYALAAQALLTPPAEGQRPALTLGAFLAFMAAFGSLSEGLTTLGRSATDFADSAARQRLAAPILEEPTETGPGRADPGPLAGHVAVSGVTFRYHANGPPVLRDVSVEVKAGEFIAVVGPSGSGKSTLLRLILGFERPEAGSVLYDGKDLAGLNPPALRRQLGVVLQSARVIGGTLLDNIAGGHLVGPEVVMAAAQDAGLADDIAAMPMGIHTLISEGGANLSGGQRQRLLLARALVLNPKVVILDEATSALDSARQAQVTASLERRRVTRIVVAHRLSTVRNADRIYVLDAGRVVQAGRYEELAGQGGAFARLAGGA
jgi:ATP-binding cassette subfamily C protein